MSGPGREDQRDTQADRRRAGQRREADAKARRRNEALLHLGYVNPQRAAAMVQQLGLSVPQRVRMARVLMSQGLGERAWTSVGLDALRVSRATPEDHRRPGGGPHAPGVYPANVAFGAMAAGSPPAVGRAHRSPPLHITGFQGRAEGHDPTAGSAGLPAAGLGRPHAASPGVLGAPRRSTRPTAGGRQTGALARGLAPSVAAPTASTGLGLGLVRGAAVATPHAAPSFRVGPWAPGVRALWRRAAAKVEGEDEAALQATEAARSPLPHLETLQAAFGSHDLRGVRAAVGGDGGRAGEALRGQGALGVARGERVAFVRAPDLRLAAHEAAHVVQQRSAAGRAASEQALEAHAEAVAERVASGQGAEDLLDAFQSQGHARRPFWVAGRGRAKERAPEGHAQPRSWVGPRAGGNGSRAPASPGPSAMRPPWGARPTAVAGRRGGDRDGRSVERQGRVIQRRSPWAPALRPETARTRRDAGGGLREAAPSRALFARHADAEQRRFLELYARFAHLLFDEPVYAFLEYEWHYERAKGDGARRAFGTLMHEALALRTVAVGEELRERQEAYEENHPQAHGLKPGPFAGPARVGLPQQSSREELLARSARKRFRAARAQVAWIYLQNSQEQRQGLSGDPKRWGKRLRARYDKLMEALLAGRMSSDHVKEDMEEKTSVGHAVGQAGRALTPATLNFINGALSSIIGSTWDETLGQRLEEGTKSLCHTLGVEPDYAADVLTAAKLSGNVYGVMAEAIVTHKVNAGMLTVLDKSATLRYFKKAVDVTKAADRAGRLAKFLKNASTWVKVAITAVNGVVQRMRSKRPPRDLDDWVDIIIREIGAALLTVGIKAEVTEAVIPVMVTEAKRGESVKELEGKLDEQRSIRDDAHDTYVRKKRTVRRKRRRKKAVGQVLRVHMDQARHREASARARIKALEAKVKTVQGVKALSSGGRAKDLGLMLARQLLVNLVMKLLPQLEKHLPLIARGQESPELIMSDAMTVLRKTLVTTVTDFAAAVVWDGRVPPQAIPLLKSGVQSALGKLLDAAGW